MKKFLKNLKFNESTVSMVLGAIIVVLLSGLLFTYFKSVNKTSTNDETKIMATSTTNLEAEPELKDGEYLVKPGDNLWDIAVAQTGSGFNWVKIYQANHLVVGNNPNLIYPGQKLVLK